MPLLGQASGGWTESSSALRILNLGIANSVGVLTDDSFTQTNPPIVTAAATITAQVDQTLTGVLSGSVCFARGDAGGGSNFIGGPPAIAALQNVSVLGVFINSANGNSFENTPGTASGKGPYVSGQGTFGNTLFEDADLTGVPGAAITAYAVGQNLYASRNGYLTNCLVAQFAQSTIQLWHAVDAFAAASVVGDPDLPPVIGIVKMVPDATQGDLVYDQRI
jgi:hypothetical protein